MNFLVAYPSVALTLVLVLALALRGSFVPGDRRRTEWLLTLDDGNEKTGTLHRGRTLR